MRLILLCGLLLSASAYAGPPPATPLVPGQAPAAQRAIQFNGRALDAAGLGTLGQLEALYGTRLPDGAYWYDPICGAFGAWGGPTLVVIPAGLALGGPVPAGASGGGDGKLSGVFINGREIHPFDLLYLQNIVGPIQPGRYFLDAYGNAGPEGGQILVNLVVASQQKAGFSYYSSNGFANTSHSISSEGVSFTSDTGKTVSWYPGLGSSVSE